MLRPAAKVFWFGEFYVIEREPRKIIQFGWLEEPFVELIYKCGSPHKLESPQSLFAFKTTHDVVKW